MTRDEAVELGRTMGAVTARKLGETGSVAVTRVARAAAYAAWDHDGRPLGGWDRYRKEFGLAETRLVESTSR